MKLRDFIAFLGMWLVNIMFLISLEFIFQLSKFSYFSTITPYKLTQVFFNSIFLLSLPGIAIISIFFLPTLILENAELLKRIITKVLLFTLSLALVFVCLIHFTTWIYTSYKVDMHQISQVIKYLILIFLIFLSYLIYRKTHSIHSYFSHKYKYILSIFSLFVIIGLSTIVFEYPKYSKALTTSKINSNKKKLPNIILFCSDGLDPDNTSVYGYERDTTPNLRKLAESSTIFYRAHYNAYNSKGTTSTILTGKLSVTTKVFGQASILQGVDSFQHLPGILKSLGYYNVDYGTLDTFGTTPTAINLRGGYDEVNGKQIPLLLGHLSFNQPIIKIFNVELYLGYTMKERFLNRWGIHTLGKVPSDLRMINMASKVIKRVNAPIFAHLHLIETHPNPPYLTYKDPIIRKFSRKKSQILPVDRDFRDDTILSADYMLGKLIKVLKETGKWDNTLLIFYSDHGREIEDGKVISNSPLIIKYPGKNQPESCSFPVQHLDIAPSILKQLGMPIPKWMEGDPSLIDVNTIKPEKFYERPIYSFVPNNKNSFNTVNVFKKNHYFRLDFSGDRDLYLIKSKPFAFIPYYNNKLEEYYVKLITSFISKKGYELPANIEINKLKTIVRDYRDFKILLNKKHNLYFGTMNFYNKTLLPKQGKLLVHRKYITYHPNLKQVKLEIDQYWTNLIKKREEKRINLAKRNKLVFANKDNIAYYQNGGIGRATHSRPRYSALRLNDGNYGTFWGSTETKDDTIFYITRSAPYKGKVFKIVLFTPANGGHLKEVSVVATNDNIDGNQKWHIIKARIGSIDPFTVKITVPNEKDGTIIKIELDTSDPNWKKYKTFGLACFSGTKGYERNYVDVGNGIYVREFAIFKNDQ